MVDINKSLTNAAENLCRQGHKVVVLGHTHIPRIKLNLYRKYFRIDARIYINTGFLSPSKADLDHKESNFTFAEVEQQDGKYNVRLKKVDYPGTTISTMQELSIPI
jgi:predicted phosphodiesterase